MRYSIGVNLTGTPLSRISWPVRSISRSTDSLQIVLDATERGLVASARLTMFFHTRDDFARIERLGDVVIGSELKADDSIGSCLAKRSPSGSGHRRPCAPL